MLIEPCATCTVKPCCTVAQRLERLGEGGPGVCVDEIFRAVDLGYPRTEVVNWDVQRGEALLWCKDYSIKK